MTCERCESIEDVTDEGACMIAHCAECLARCRYCQDDMRGEVAA